MSTVTRSITRALNCYVRVDRDIELDVLAQVQLPARRIQRRESVPEAGVDLERIHNEQLVAQNEHNGVMEEQPRMVQNRRHSISEMERVAAVNPDAMEIVEQRFNQVLGQQGPIEGEDIDPVEVLLNTILCC